MKVEEALKYFKDGYKSAVQYQTTHTPSPDIIMVCQNFEVAIETMEKQIPKKPVNVTENTFGEARGRCFNCSTTVMHGNDNYCPKCGQRIDWDNKK